MRMEPLSVVILTFNEEANIEGCLKSIHGYANRIFIVDSYSTDKTLEIAKQYTNDVYQNKFIGYSQQRNWALRNLPFPGEWTFILDADERLTQELKDEIDVILSGPPSDVTGYYVKRRFIFMGRWIKHGGYYPVWFLRFFRYPHAFCEEREVSEHYFVKGETARLNGDFIHEDRKGISSWIEKHNRYASLYALDLQKAPSTGKPNISLFGEQAERKRYLWNILWRRLPPLLRPFAYFFYRYFLMLGFLDCKEGAIYHFLHGLWYMFLIDVKYLELQRKSRVQKPKHK